MEELFGISYSREEDRWNMNKNDTLIYDFNEHGLYYKTKDYNRRRITFAIGTIEMDFDYDTGKLLTVTAFLPLIKAKRQLISMPIYVEDDFHISVEGLEYSPGIAYDYSVRFFESKNYFLKDSLPRVYYDEINKRILIGTQSSSDRSIRINKHLICGLDKKENLKYLLISPDIIID